MHGQHEGKQHPHSCFYQLKSLIGRAHGHQNSEPKLKTRQNISPKLPLKSDRSLKLYFAQLEVAASSELTTLKSVATQH